MDIGESLVAAYLRHVRGCEVILTNVHLAGVQGEIDVIGLERQTPQTLWLCEVTTHTRGMNNPAKKPAAQRVKDKIDRAADFASEVFPSAHPKFEVWSPIVRAGLISELEEVAGHYTSQQIELHIVANETYTQRIQELVDVARETTATTGNDAFRMLQILTRLRGALVV
jgi:Holliday junction resolvase-like predicted endonuclease